MIFTDEYGTYGKLYKCPNCEFDHGPTFHHITEQIPILCNKCLNDDNTDIKLRIKTLIYLVGQLQVSVDDVSDVASGFRMIR